MGANDAAEMLEEAKAEVVRLERARKAAWRSIWHLVGECSPQGQYERFDHHRMVAGLKEIQKGDPS